jgi:3-hydroxyisobutyrate dehydrogenase
VTSPLRVAVLGLGAMGSAIAGRLLDEGFALRVWNRNPARGEHLVERGALRVATPAEAARSVDVVVTSLSDDDAVRAVVLGKDGVIHGLGADAVLVDMSTVAPDTSRELAAAVGGRFVDAPILGGPTAVADHQATSLLGGEDDMVDKVAPVVAAVSARQLRCGPVGAGETVKLVANLLLLGQLAVLCEAVATAQANGVDDRLIAELGRMPLVAPSLQNRLDDVIHGQHEGWFSARLGLKDISLVRSLARRAGLDLAVAGTVAELFEQTVAAGLGDLDIAAVVETVRARRVPAPAAS